MVKLIIAILLMLSLTGCAAETVLPATAVTMPAAETTLEITEDTVLCVSCNAQPSGGYGPSGMECANCYYGNDAILEGIYIAEFEHVQITLTHHDYVDYILTYTDLTSGITLERIPMAYYSANSDTEIAMMFFMEESYPKHSGYVEICWSESGLFPYSYNAIIDGLEGTGGDYSPLSKVN